MNQPASDPNMNPGMNQPASDPNMNPGMNQPASDQNIANSGTNSNQLLNTLDPNPEISDLMKTLLQCQSVGYINEEERDILFGLLQSDSSALEKLKKKVGLIKWSVKVARANDRLKPSTQQSKTPTVYPDSKSQAPPSNEAPTKKESSLLDFFTSQPTNSQSGGSCRTCRRQFNTNKTLRRF
jgi:hypothetical protein